MNNSYLFKCQIIRAEKQSLVFAKYFIMSLNDNGSKEGNLTRVLHN
jgi:hypothetical protein